MKRTATSIALCALLAFVTSACKPDPSSNQREDRGPKQRRLTVLAAGDVGSDTDVCGCKAHPLGGLARRAKLVRDRADRPTLLLDGGDLYFRSWDTPPRWQAQAKETALLHADVMKALGATAMAVGERDLAFGLPFLRALEARSGTQLLAANLVHAQSGTVAFTRFVLIERGGIRVGIVGAAPELPEGSQAFQVYRDAGLKALPAGPALEEAAGAARKAGAEVVIGLLHIGQARSLEVLSALPEGNIDLALIAHDRSSSQFQVIGGGKSALYALGERGKWLAEVELTLADGAHGFFDTEAIDAQKQQIEAISARIAAYNNEDAGVSDPAAAQRLASDRIDTVKRLDNRRSELKTELRALDGQKRHRASGHLIEVEPTLLDDPAVAVMVKAYQDRLSIVNAGEPLPNRNELSYTGAVACKQCHEAAYAQWQTTPHARAWATLVGARQTANLDCVGCHMTGFDRPGGPSRLAGMDPFVNVGCESCHGPGNAHVANPKLALDYMRNVPEKLCAECHRAQADQKAFVYEDRLPKVLGKGHGRKK